MILLAGTSLEDEKVIRGEDLNYEGKYITCLQYHKNHPFTEIKNIDCYGYEWRDYVLLEYY